MSVVKLQSKDSISAVKAAQEIVNDKPENLVAVYRKDGEIHIVSSSADRLELMGMLSAAQVELWINID